MRQAAMHSRDLKRDSALTNRCGLDAVTRECVPACTTTLLLIPAYAPSNLALLCITLAGALTCPCAQMSAKDLGPRMQRLHQERAGRTSWATAPDETRQQHSPNGQSVSVGGAGPAAGPKTASQAGVPRTSTSLQLEGAEYEAFVANVAASIIQQHWRHRRIDAQGGSERVASASQQDESCMPEQASASEAGSSAQSAVQPPRGGRSQPHTSPCQRARGEGGAGNSSGDDVDELLSRYRDAPPPAEAQPRSSEEIVQNAEAIVKAAGLALRASGAHLCNLLPPPALMCHATLLRRALAECADKCAGHAGRDSAQGAAKYRYATDVSASSHAAHSRSTRAAPSPRSDSAPRSRTSHDRPTAAGAMFASQQHKDNNSAAGRESTTSGLSQASQDDACGVSSACVRADEAQPAAAAARCVNRCLPRNGSQRPFAFFTARDTVLCRFSICKCKFRCRHTHALAAKHAVHDSRAAALTHGEYAAMGRVCSRTRCRGICGQKL